MSKKQLKQAKQATMKRYSAVPSKAKASVQGAVATIEAPVEAVAVRAVAIEAKPVMKETPAAVVGTATPVSNSTPVSTAPSAACLTAVNELRNLDADAACEAASLLGTLGETFAVPALVQVVENADGYFHPVVRAAASESLGKLKDARALDALVHATRDTMAEASAEAVRALSMIGDARAVEPLVQIVQNTDGYFAPVVRRAAVIALSKLGGPIAMAELVRVAADVSEDAVIRQAAEAR